MRIWELDCTGMAAHGGGSFARRVRGMLWGLVAILMIGLSVPAWSADRDIICKVGHEGNCLNAARLLITGSNWVAPDEVAAVAILDQVVGRMEPRCEGNEFEACEALLVAASLQPGRGMVAFGLFIEGNRSAGHRLDPDLEFVQGKLVRLCEDGDFRACGLLATYRPVLEIEKSAETPGLDFSLLSFRALDLHLAGRAVAHERCVQELDVSACIELSRYAPMLEIWSEKFAIARQIDAVDLAVPFDVIETLVLLCPQDPQACAAAEFSAGWVVFDFGDQTEIEVAAIAQRFEPGCRDGNWSACALIAFMTYNSWRDRDRKLLSDQSLFDRACNAGSAMSCGVSANTRLIKDVGLSVPVHLDEATGFLAKGCELGTLSHCLMLDDLAQR